MLESYRRNFFPKIILFAISFFLVEIIILKLLPVILLRKCEILPCFSSYICTRHYENVITNKFLDLYYLSAKHMHSNACACGLVEEVLRFLFLRTKLFYEMVS